MKILIADRDKAFCLRLPLTLMCNWVGAALLTGGLRATRILPGPSGMAKETAVITTAQVHGALKALRQSKKTLREAGLPLLDMEERDGSRILITL